MGFFDSLFGSGKKAEAPKKKKKEPSAPPVATEQAPAAAVTVEGDIDPKIVAAILAGISAMDDDAELMAAIAAAIVHARAGGVGAVSFRRAGNAWAASGRQKNMDRRQFA